MSEPINNRPSKYVGNVAFETDHFNRREVAKKLTAHIQNLRYGQTIAIDASWGAGHSQYADGPTSYISRNLVIWSL